MNSAPAVKPPVFNLPRVFQAREKVLDGAFFPYLAQELVGDVLHQLAEEVRKVLNLPVGSHPAVMDSIRCRSGRVLTLPEAKELAWRLGGNVDRLRNGESVLPWAHQDGFEWAPVQIISSRYHVRKSSGAPRGESGRIFHFRFLAGSPCPGTASKFWSNRMLAFVSRHIGFTDVRRHLFKKDGAELTSLRMLVFLEPHLSRQGPGFKQIHCPPSLLEYNQGIIKMRRRIGFKCPFNYAHECFQCPRGLQACEAATHPEEFERRICASCGKEAWFDTDPRFLNDFCCACQPLIDSGVRSKPKEIR